MSTDAGGMSDLPQLRREIRTALELAIVSLAPNDLIDRLALVAGLLEALVELPADSPPAVALLPPTVDRGRAMLDQWNRWYAARGRRA